MPIRRIGAVILHARQYRERSVIAELLTEDDERIGCVLHGGGRARGSHHQPFTELSLMLRGRGDLYTGQGVESGARYGLTGRALVSGLYLNELVLRLVPRACPVAELYGAYREALHRLASGPLESTLRCFELELLEGLGYGLVLDEQADEGGPIDPDGRYRYDPEAGPRRVTEPSDQCRDCISGRVLYALRDRRLDDPSCLREAKILMARVLQHHLGGRVLATREMMRAYGELKRGGDLSGHA